MVAYPAPNPPSFLSARRFKEITLELRQDQSLSSLCKVEIVPDEKL